MKFRNKLKTRLVYGIIIIVLGFTAFVLGIIKNIQNGADFGLLSYYAGTGGGLIAVGILTVKKSFSALSNKQKMKNLKVEEQDERNIQITYKAGYFTFALSAVILYAVSLLLMFMESALFRPVMALCSGIVFLYLLFYTLVRKLS